MAATPGSFGTRLAPLRLRAQRFWRWWTGELVALLPARFTAIAGQGRAPLVAFRDGRLVLVENAGAEGPTQVDLRDGDTGRSAADVKAMLERAGETRGRVRIALAQGEALVRRVSMPAATEENLANVLGFEMDRLTPFRAEEVYYDHRVVGRDAAAGTLAVLVAVARREVVEAHLARARELGLSVQALVAAEESPRPGAPLDLLPGEERGERDKPQERMAKQLLAAAALILLLAALGVPVLLKNREVHAIRPTLDKAATEARATGALVQELERLVADHNFLLQRRHAAYPTLAYIEEITRLLPDNTWLQQLEIKQVGKVREVLMSGETVSSSRLIEIIEQSRLLQNAAPRGTVTRGTQPGTERFVISAEARPRTPPEAVAVTEAQAALALAPAYAPPQAPPTTPQAAPQTATVTPTAPGSAVSAAPAGTENLIFRPGGRPYVPQVPHELLKQQPPTK